jgi:hypothetical protein
VVPGDNPRPYDDTGWNSPALRNVTTIRIDDKTIFDKPMTLVSAPEITVPGSDHGTGATIVIDNVADNTLATFAFANKALKMRSPSRRSIWAAITSRPARSSITARRARASSRRFAERPARVGDRCRADACRRTR